MHPHIKLHHVPRTQLLNNDSLSGWNLVIYVAFSVITFYCIAVYFLFYFVLLSKNQNATIYL